MNSDALLARARAFRLDSITDDELGYPLAMALATVYRLLAELVRIRASDDALASKLGFGRSALTEHLG